MAMLVHAKVMKGKKRWYLYGGVGEETNIKEYPNVRTRSDLYTELRKEFNLPVTTTSTQIVFMLFDKTWTGEKWVDDFTLRLKELREKKGWTQSDLAEKSGLSVQAVAAIEQGTRGPTWETVLKLAHSMDYKIEDFKVDPKSMKWSEQAAESL